MKLSAAWIIVAMLVSSTVFTQIQMKPLPESGVLSGSHPVAGSHLLRDKEEAVREYLRTHPDVVSQMGARKRTAWNFSVGSKYTWYADDFTNNSRYQVSSTCKAVGNTCYVFAEDASWASGRIAQDAVDSVRSAFDLRTPANPSQGIYQMDVEGFGFPPDVDGDPRIVILILDIRDGWNGSGGYVAGYFYGFNEIPKSVAGYSTSNEAEIYFLDCNPLNLTTSSGLTVGMSTTAHEFQHMIHFNYDRTEIRFIDEMCSLTAEVHCGYAIFDPDRYANETNHYLLDWRTDLTAGLGDYSRAARFGVYLHDQFGIGVFRDIVASPLHGISGLDAGFAALGTPRRFSDIFVDWLVANTLDDASVDPRYGYLYHSLPMAAGTTYFNPNVPSTNETVETLASEYLLFKGGSDLHVNFASSGLGLGIKAVEKGPSSKRVLDVTPGTEFSEPAFGMTYTEIDFVLFNVNQSAPVSYSYNARGVGASALELKWDSTEPTGYLPLSPDDTVCVAFDGIAGAKLDSIRVALRRAGSMTGGVWRYSGATRPTPLGAPLALPVMATSTATPDYPYPVPWPNWSTVDLHSRSIDAGSPFVVGFVCAGDPQTHPRVMTAPYPSTSPYHSFTYLHAPSSGSPDWYYLTKNADTIWTYLIRAYVSFGSGDSGGHELTPGSFVLGQNYPNPFNPSTTIRYSLAADDVVRLNVYNLLGEEVAVLIDDRQTAGDHLVVWTPKNLATGPYIYRLQSGGNTESRKLLYVK